ncbi:COG0863 DNA modification methylase [uncultured Caudovirales phage]|uniref:site-specific DNA-methyltransferase (cytosine-N(4)-specific) n=1 Tax=uncultured Caudovirales phage TaxID=2100421 RepID=A0A6J5LAA4_9CAUD|nr:COG0863 DNA modification methylase [uncultured Caudovirales phage]
MIENYINKVINGDTIDVMSEMPEGWVDLVVTSPPYNVGIKYDTHNDEIVMDEYWEWSEKWLTEAYRLLKDDGRMAINIPYEVNVQARGGRVFFASELYQVMKKVGFKFYGIVDLEEDSPHRSKTTAWGSWMSPSAPYIYNPKECVILAYKKVHIKKVKGEPQWKGEPYLTEDGKNKVAYAEQDKKEFMELVFGQWKYFADTRTLTKATFSMDIPEKAIKILSYKNDVVLDPFNGSGTSCVAAVVHDRRWVGIELSSNYCEIAKQRIQSFVDQKNQQKLEFENGVK